MSTFKLKYFHSFQHLLQHIVFTGIYVEMVRKDGYIGKALINFNFAGFRQLLIKLCRTSRLQQLVTT